MTNNARIEPRLLWRAITPNHYVADIGAARGAVEAIRRSTWKRTHPNHPWFIVVFGIQWNCDWMAHLDDAKRKAERVARELVDSMEADPLFGAVRAGQRPTKGGAR